jgi:acyl dehydratase
MSFETPCFENVNVGDPLPQLSIAITPSLIVGGAIASRDFTPVHHDASAARAQGMQDVFMNILTTNGLVGRYVTDWAGRDARLEGVAIKLGAPNLPGDTMRLSGRVKSKDEARGAVEVEVSGANAWGDHVTATVTLILPRRA